MARQIFTFQKQVSSRHQMEEDIMQMLEIKTIAVVSAIAITVCCLISCKSSKGFNKNYPNIIPRECAKLNEAILSNNFIRWKNDSSGINGNRNDIFKENYDFFREGNFLGYTPACILENFGPPNDSQVVDEDYCYYQYFVSFDTSRNNLINTNTSLYLYYYKYLDTISAVQLIENKRISPAEKIELSFEQFDNCDSIDYLISDKLANRWKKDSIGFRKMRYVSQNMLKGLSRLMGKLFLPCIEKKIGPADYYSYRHVTGGGKFVDAHYYLGSKLTWEGVEYERKLILFYDLESLKLIEYVYGFR